MEHAKKMLLVDPSIFEKIKQQSSVDSPTSRLDTEMQNILNSHMEDRKKCILYLQILQRYLHFTEEGRQPLELPLVLNTNLPEDVTDDKNKDIDTSDAVATETSNGEEKQVKNIFLNKKNTYTPRHILSLIPKTYTRKGELLLNLVALNTDKIEWDDVGTVIINKEKIAGSNILDLVNDCVRPLKNNDPIGWQQFATALKEIQIPITYIGNPKRSDFIKQLQLKDLEQTTPHQEAFSTPKSRNRYKHVRRIQQKIDWEKWTPY